MNNELIRAVRLSFMGTPRFCVGRPTGDSDRPDEAEDLADVIVFDDFYTELVRYDRYGSVPITSELTPEDQTYLINRWVDEHETNVNRSLDKARNEVRVLETWTSDLARIAASQRGV